MTEERKHAILLATVILTARRLQPLLEEDDRECKPNMATEFWAEVARVFHQHNVDQLLVNGEIKAHCITQRANGSLTPEWYSLVDGTRQR